MKKPLAVGAAGLLVSLAGADPVISNLTSTGSTGTNLGVKAAGFRMPVGASFRLDGVTIGAIAAVGQPVHPTFAIFEGDAAPTTQVVTLRVPAAVATGLMRLVPVRGVELEAGRTYWIVGSFGGGGDVIWAQNNDVLPTGLATHVGYLFNGNPSSVENSYRLDGTWSEACINFDALPGADNIIGTADDVPIAAPALFLDQPAQVTTDFMTQGVVFLPNPGEDNRHEILTNDTFPGRSISSEPNLFTTAGSGLGLDGQINATFMAPVYRVEAGIGLSGSSETLEIFDGSGALIDSASGTIARVTLESSRPIASMRLRGTGGPTTSALDDLCLGFFPPASCQADLTGSSDPNDPAYGVPDGFVDASDFFFYLDRFVEPCP